MLLSSPHHMRFAKAMACRPPPPDLVEPATVFTVADFDQLGTRHGFRYRLPALDPGAGRRAGTRIAEGRIREDAIRPGLTLVTSDVTPHLDYESTSQITPRLSAIVMLQGQAHARLHRDEPQTLRATAGYTAVHDGISRLSAHHAARQRMLSVNLSLEAPDAALDTALAEMAHVALRRPGIRPWPGPLPAHLTQAMATLLHCPWTAPLQALLREGVCLQLLAHALAAEDSASAGTAVPARELTRLERVRDCIRAEPGADHRLADLARLACMSPSTLRSKFQVAYGMSVFGFVQRERLEAARRHLLAGASVGEAAEIAGYRHPANFATAFRQRFGAAPRQWTRGVPRQPA